MTSKKTKKGNKPADAKNLGSGFLTDPAMGTRHRTLSPVILVTMKDDRFDTSDLKRFSDYVTFVHDECLYDAEDMMPMVMFKAHYYLRRFRPEIDYIALAGDSLVCAGVMATAGRMFKRVRVLKFDRQEKAYYPIWLNNKA